MDSRTKLGVRVVNVRRVNVVSATDCPDAVLDTAHLESHLTSSGGML